MFKLLTLSILLVVLLQTSYVNADEAESPNEGSHNDTSSEQPTSPEDEVKNNRNEVKTTRPGVIDPIRLFEERLTDDNSYLKGIYQKQLDKFYQIRKIMKPKDLKLLPNQNTTTTLVSDIKKLSNDSQEKLNGFVKDAKTYADAIRNMTQESEILLRIPRSEAEVYINTLATIGNETQSAAMGIKDMILVYHKAAKSFDDYLIQLKSLPNLDTLDEDSDIIDEAPKQLIHQIQDLMTLTMEIAVQTCQGYMRTLQTKKEELSVIKESFDLIMTMPIIPEEERMPQELLIEADQKAVEEHNRKLQEEKTQQEGQSEQESETKAKKEKKEKKMDKPKTEVKDDL